MHLHAKLLLPTRSSTSAKPTRSPQQTQKAAPDPRKPTQLHPIPLTTPQPTSSNSPSSCDTPYSSSQNNSPETPTAAHSRPWSQNKHIPSTLPLPPQQHHNTPSKTPQSPPSSTHSHSSAPKTVLLLSHLSSCDAQHHSRNSPRTETRILISHTAVAGNTFGARKLRGGKSLPIRIGFAGRDGW
ncbi:hypothetical protein CERZMDRAFT_91363 [Cercospora zeae-maydis SCOH1-5]|uniref:Uncharacterized protein n=1 Tax=Cercospora zeae-maydis SCOH1-5 TaxID=717836 RepID=A0A6A6F578_9PEZI|nr:hypothetical protein CERZMDRAFT_91363 [Cercospora zeae-maydis SCOH1-5]